MKFICNSLVPKAVLLGDDDPFRRYSLVRRSQVTQVSPGLHEMLSQQGYVRAG